MAFDLLLPTLDELWAIHDYVRQHDKLGQEWDKDFGVRVMADILEVQEHPAQQTTLICTEDELWQITRQIPSFLTVGSQPVGRDLLTKVMRLIVKMRGTEADDECTDAGGNAGGEPARGSDGWLGRLRNH